ncbi:RNA polymerase factor sigma-54 [Thioalkalivibrio sp.]|uniref:RNA polymerase factor sigma-54 n=1 Tax=Thioalkalivibrio sp. TaxID=2093813 RepID=UPI0012D5CE62|nr:RNA polymerase factor sigma-54 [Thioalkalivibrio sp.]TVP79914.1 MAG: RNA polymerase factor sigma-54 [Thioalkalivibrio sp.]
MLKSSLNLQLGQNLTMTPQLQQAIRLLQLSTLELQLEVQQALDSNPMLELAEENPADEASSPETKDDAEPEAPTVEGSTDEGSWEELSYTGGTGAQGAMDDRDPFENQAGSEGGLHEHLLWQLHLSPLNERDQRIGAALIDSINTDGYLETDLESLQQTLGGEEALGVDEIEAVLHWIQQCDPVGVGARDLRECLLIQLRAMSDETPAHAAALQVVDTGMPNLARHDFRALQRDLGLDETTLARAVELIRTLNPRPGSHISDQPPEYVTPDVYVRRDNGGWRVDLNPDIAPRIRINSLYAGMVRRVSDARDSAFMRNQLQEARWFLKSLHSRNDTLLRVARAIVERQSAFLEQGDVAMQPLILRDIAEALGMHESTISRVTTQKYMHTPRGVFEFKYFFSSHVGTSDGGECSATAIRAMIRQLISEEPPNRPMSDSRLAQVLSDRGINVARRTVAKYREAMNLPPSSERRQLL